MQLCLISNHGSEKPLDWQPRAVVTLHAVDMSVPIYRKKNEGNSLFVFNPKES